MNSTAITAKGLEPRAALLVCFFAFGFVQAFFVFPTRNGYAAEAYRVENTAEPAQGVQRVELEEQWRVGGDDDDDFFSGIINRALIDDNNNIYLLDPMLNQVSVFSPEGELIRTLGREGEGPGEFRSPADMCFLPNGNLGICQAFPGKIIQLGLDNSPAGTWEYKNSAEGGFFILRALKSCGGNLVASGVVQSVDQSNGLIVRRNFVSSLVEGGSLGATYTELEHTMNLNDLKLDEMVFLESPDARFDVSSEGKVVVAIPRYGYEVSVFDESGELEMVFGRPYKSWKRDEHTLDMWRKIMDLIERTEMPGVPVFFEEYQPDIEILRVANDGSIWILTSRAMWDSPEGIFTSYDVFSADGVYQKKLDIVCKGDSRKDFLFFAGDDLAFVVTGFWEATMSRMGGVGEAEQEPEPMEIVCYRIK